MSDAVPEEGTATQMQDPRRLVLVIGAGRSGTSMVTGTLNHLGLHVPPPVIGADETNPRGFFESRWAIDFHKRLVRQAGIDEFDGRPQAMDIVSAADRTEFSEELKTWLADAAGQAPQLVVKDPRSLWARDLWEEAARSTGLSVGYLTMLRHPAEVVGSRSAYYASDFDEERARGYQLTKLAGWVNVTLINERLSRGDRRVFVRYNDLMADWRSVMAEVAVDLGLRFDTNLSSREPHAVDEFVDPELRRIRVTWDELAPPDGLRDIAEDVWQACGVLADSHGSDTKAQDMLDAAAERYARLYADAGAIVRNATTAQNRRAREKAVRETRAKMRKQLAASAGSSHAPARRRTVRQVASAVRRRVRRR